MRDRLISLENAQGHWHELVCTNYGMAKKLKVTVFTFYCATLCIAQTMLRNSLSVRLSVRHTRYCVEPRLNIS